MLFTVDRDGDMQQQVPGRSSLSVDCRAEAGLRECPELGIQPLRAGFVPLRQLPNLAVSGGTRRFLGAWHVVRRWRWPVLVALLPIVVFRLRVVGTHVLLSVCALEAGEPPPEWALPAHIRIYTFTLCVKLDIQMVSSS